MLSQLIGLLIETVAAVEDRGRIGGFVAEYALLKSACSDTEVPEPALSKAVYIGNEGEAPINRGSR